MIHIIEIAIANATLATLMVGVLHASQVKLTVFGERGMLIP